MPVTPDLPADYAGPTEISAANAAADMARFMNGSQDFTGPQRYLALLIDGVKTQLFLMAGVLAETAKYGTITRIRRSRESAFDIAAGRLLPADILNHKSLAP